MSKKVARRARRRSNLLLRKLEERILFDASMDMGVVLEESMLPIPPIAEDSQVMRPEAFMESRSDQAGQIAPDVTYELVIIDGSVDDHQQLLDELRVGSDPSRSLQFVVLEADTDGIDQLSRILSRHTQLDAIHIISHGEDANVRLGNQWLGSENLAAHAGTIAGWGSALAEHGDILFYGCDLAASAEGKQLIDSVAALTGADVAASEDDTGSVNRGGDWILEHQAGSIETGIVFSEQLMASYTQVFAAGPVVSFISAPSNVFIGENFDFTVRFNNTGADPGFGPFIDLIFPTNGIDGAAGTDTADGISFVSATYLGLAVNAITLTFPDDDGVGLGTTGTIDHPFAKDNTGAPMQITGTAGDTLVVLELPFGSFSPGQPPVDLVVTANVSSLADAGAPLAIQTRSGFRYGNDPLENPTSDPSLVSDAGTDVSNPSLGATSWIEQISVAPTLIAIEKLYLGPEDETATGPNHQQQYTLRVDIADGQTIRNLDIIDRLPPNMIVTSIDSVTVGGVAAPFSNNLASLTLPGNNQDLTVTLTNDVTGGTTNADVVVTFSFYIAEFDADAVRVIPPNGEDDLAASVSENNARAVGDWTPVDTRDAGGTNNAVADPDPIGPEHVLDDKSIAIQKTVAIVTNTGNSGATPGDVLEYVLRFQISDYFTFGDLIIDDVFQDGQRFDFTYGATLDVTDVNGNITGSFAVRSITAPDGGETLIVDETQIDNSDNVGEDGVSPDGSDGTTTLRFDLSQALIDNGAADGVLQGGLTVDAVNRGAAIGTIRFRTIIQEDYSDTFASGDRSVDHGDVITNANLTITGSVRENQEDNVNATLFETIGTESDTSSASITIVGGSLTKDIYAINGNTTLPIGPSGKVLLTPGDLVTYRVTFTLPSSDFEDLVITDFLSLPIFDVDDHNGDGVADSWVFDIAGSFDAAAPSSGVVQFGAGDTFYNSRGPASNIVPTITVDAGSNGLRLNFGDYDDPTSQSSVIQLYITVTAQNEPTADGLFLTNIVRVEEGTTQQTPNVADQIVQIEVTQPVLNITKGIVSSNNAGRVFDSPVGPGGITFATAGDNASPVFSGGVIHSNGLAAQQINANITSGVDAGDLVRYAIVIENTGNSTRGAYDVSLADALPANLNYVAGSLRIVDGFGDSVAYTGAEADLFGAGITLNDPGATPDAGDGTNAGAIDGYHATSGRNIVIVFYDAQIQSTADAAEALSNTASLTSFAGQEGGLNHLSAPLTDDATASVSSAGLVKTLVSTEINNANNANNQAVIGELITYQVVINVPEGEMLNVRLLDQLDAGLAFVSANISASAGLSTSQGTFANVASGATVSNIGSGAVNLGRQIDFNFGTITNSNTVNATAEQITITYQAVVVNATSNNAGVNRNNAAQLTWTGGSPQSDSAANVRILEPTVTLSKTASSLIADVGDTITFTLLVTNTGGTYGADAFEVTLEDVLPTGFNFAGNLTHNAGVAPTTLSESSGTITADWSLFAFGQTSTITFDATVNGLMPLTGSTNTASIDWTSLSGDVTSPRSVYNTLSVERTGDSSDPAQATSDNDYAASSSVFIDFPVSPVKSIVATSESHTSDATTDTSLNPRLVAIGEIVTYELRIGIGEGNLSNVVLRDFLTNGFTLLSNTVQFEIISDVNMTVAADLAGANAGSITLPAGRISMTPGATQTIEFALGNITNNDNDANVEELVIRFDVIASNTSVNNDGNVKTNSFQFQENSVIHATSNTVYAEIVEPEIINVDKRVISTSLDGTQVTYQVRFANSGSASAFDVSVLDSLAAELDLQILSISVANTGSVSGIDSTNSNVNLLDIRIGEMGAGATVTIEYTVDVAFTGTAIRNDVDVTYSSLPGAQGTANATPGNSGDANGERNGNGVGVNTYTDTEFAFLGAIGDRLWYDIDSDGTIDAGEPALAGVTVQLIWFGVNGVIGGGDDITRTTTTDSNGNYLFSGVAAGNFSVSVITASLPNGLTDPTYDLNGIGTLHTAPVTLVETPAGMIRNNLDFGYTGTGLIGNTVFFDYDESGTQNNGEPGIAGVTVTLVWEGFAAGFADGDEVTYTTVTDANGNYSFGDLPPGAFTVTVNQSTIDFNKDTVADTVVLTTASNPMALSLTAGQTNLNADFGYRGIGSIGDRIFFDHNGNGVQNGTEAGYVGLTVTLSMDFDSNGTVDYTVTTITDSNGDYLFDNLPPGEYDITVTAPANTIVTVDPDGGANSTSNLLLANGAANTAQDFAYRGTGTIGDRVWLDLDGDGVQDVNEPGINGQNIRLDIDLDGNGSTDMTLNTTTGVNGAYQFTNLPAANYTVTVLNPLSGTNPRFDSNGVGTPHTTQLSLTAVTPSSLVQNFGYQGTGSIGNNIYWDVNNNGVRDGGEAGLYNVPVALELDFDLNGSVDHTLTTTTDINGNYLFAGLMASNYTVIVTPPAGVTQTADPDTTFNNRSTVVLAAGQNNLVQDFGYRGNSALGDVVFWDVNNNGAFNAGIDRGLAGVDVTLSSDFNGDTVADYTQTLQTDSNGNYAFNNLIPGVYTVAVNSATVPGGLATTPTLDGDGILTPHTSNVALGVGQTNNNQDFGYTGTGSVGDTVYWDANGNGNQDAGEVGLPNVTVTLYVDIDQNGSNDYTFVTTTDADGNYLFENLPPVDYTIAVTPIAGTTQTDDPDATNNHQTSFTLGNNQDKLDQDFGYRGNGTIGDLVFFDYVGDGGVFNATQNDRGLAGIDVTLAIDVNGDTTIDFTRTVTTNASGLYLFDNLIAGAYTITVDSTDLIDQLASNPTFDIDGVGTAHTSVIALTANEDNRNHDFGYHATPDYAITKSDGRVNVTSGESLSYTVSVTNNGGIRGQNVQIVDTFPTAILTNVAVTGGGVINTTLGTITWTLPSLDDGATVNFTVTADVVDVLNGSNQALINSVTVSDDAFNGIDPTIVNNTATDTDAIADIQTLKTVTNVVRSGNLWNVTFQLVVENTGSVRLDQLSLLDDLSAQFGAMFISVTNPLLDSSGMTSGGTPPKLNANWAANTSLDLLDPLDGSEFLLPGERFTITFTATLDPDASGTSSTLTNQATATGVDVTTAPGAPFSVNDLSDSGTNTTTTNPGHPGDSGGEDDATPIYVTDIALTKQQGTTTQDAITRNYFVQYTFFVENIGTVALDSLTLTDDLTAAFGNAFVGIQTGSLTIQNFAGTGISPTVNNAWESDTSVNMINAAGARLDAGDSFEVTFVVQVNPDGIDGLSQTLENQATTSGRGLNENLLPLQDGGFDIIVTDLSDSGVNANTSNAGQPGDTGGVNDPTPLSLPEIAVTKRLVQSVASGTGSNRDVTFEMVVRNVGTVDLTNLSLIDDLNARFGVAFVGVVSPPTILTSTATSDPTLSAWDGNFGGAGTADMFNGASGQLDAGQEMVIRFTVELDIDQLVSGSSNQVTAGGDYDLRPLVAGLDGTVSDLSDTGTDPASSNPGQPGDTGGFDDPTLIPAIGVAKQHGDFTEIAGTGQFELPVTLTVENLGATDLVNLTLLEDLQAQFGAVFISASVPIIDASGVTGTAPAMNAVWASDTSLNILDGTGLLRPGDTFTVTFNIIVDPDASGQSLALNNQTVVSGSDPGNPLALVTDNSDSGLNASSSNPGSPGDTGIADNPTPLQIPDIAVVKQVVSMQQLGVSITMNIELLIANTGTVDLADLQLFDDIATQYGANFNGIVGTPTIVRSTASTDPNLNGGFATDTTQNLFDGTSGLLRAGEEIVVQISVSVVAVPGQSEVIVVNQASVSATALNELGAPLTDLSGTPLGPITDLSDSGNDPTSKNPAAPGDADTYDDPTPTKLTFFAFDSFNNLSGEKQVRFTGHDPNVNERVLRPLPVDPIFSGLAEPGTTLRLTIYDQQGHMVGDRQVVADVGGNWIANFPNTIIWKQPHRMEVEQVAPIQGMQDDAGFNMRRYFHPALHHSLVFTERPTVGTIMRNSAYETIESMHAANLEPLAVGWRNHTYQLNTASSNVASN